MTEYIKMTDAITTTWMILRGMGYAAEDNPDMVKTVAAVFDTAPAAEVVERPRWIPATERLPPMERKELDEEEQTRAEISVPVLAIVRDGTYQVVRHIEETGLERDGYYEWSGWVREPDDGCGGGTRCPGGSTTTRRRSWPGG